MPSEEDINALLGISPTDIERPVSAETSSLSVVNADNLEEKIISETNNIMDSTKSALEAVLVEVQSTPNDAELIEAASNLVKAQTGLIDALSKLHITKEKCKNQTQITQMRLNVEKQMNTENNQTKVLMSREEIMAQLMNDAKAVTVIDI